MEKGREKGRFNDSGETLSVHQVTVIIAIIAGLVK
jgi:hypothetical protein